MANDQRLMAKGQDIRAALNERQLPISWCLGDSVSQ